VNKARASATRNSSKEVWKLIQPNPFPAASSNRMVLSFVGTGFGSRIPLYAGKIGQGM